MHLDQTDAEAEALLPMGRSSPAQPAPRSPSLLL